MSPRLWGWNYTGCTRLAPRSGLGSDIASGGNLADGTTAGARTGWEPGVYDSVKEWRLAPRPAETPVRRFQATARRHGPFAPRYASARPSAAGAIARPTTPASATIVSTYGIISMN